jgi:hypothetical protein
LTLEELLTLILHQLRIEGVRSSRIELWRSFEEVIARLTPGDRVVVIIDAGQDLTDETLENLRLLSNSDQKGSKRLHFILVAQPELLPRLQSAALRNVSQRIGARATLEALKVDEAMGYVNFLLRQRGGGAREIFDARALRYMIAQSAGIPRRINQLCHNSMLAAYDEGVSCVTIANVRVALSSSENSDRRSKIRSAPFSGTGLMGKAAWATVLLGSVLTAAWAAEIYLPRLDDFRRKATKVIESAAMVTTRLPPTWGTFGLGPKADR